jgi:antitoxin (DNA-binding transcriptional repressor) of toxin-antitoxin stability system
MRALDQGRAFIVTRNGVPVGELVPVRSRVFVRSETVHTAFAGAPRINTARFRRDLDAVIDQSARPRG